MYGYMIKIWDLHLVRNNVSKYHPAYIYSMWMKMFATHLEEKKMFKKKEKPYKYIIMSRIDGSNHFYSQKGFATREDADTYARLLMKTEDYDKNKYYLFEQSQAYSQEEKVA